MSKETLSKKRLTFEPTSVGEKHKLYLIYNKKEEFLGQIGKVRVGTFMHWVFEPHEETFFTNGCLKEISSFITKLYSKKEKNLQNE